MKKMNKKLALLVVLGMVLVAFQAWGKEIGPNQVQGKVTQFSTKARKGTIGVKSDQTGKTYTFYVGLKTLYVPRYPGVGEKVKVSYINDRGYLKATHVEIVPSS